MLRLRTVLAVALLAVVVSGCKREESADGQLTVFAASSLRDVFTSLGARFEQAHPGAKVTFSFAGSQELRTQIEHGASVDVFASADRRQMDLLVEAKRVETPVVFARNALVLVIAKGQAPEVHALADLPTLDRIVVGAPDVPVGHYTAQLLDRAGADFRARVEAKVVSRELNARQVLAKVSLGEAQAGFVYRTDALPAADRVRVVELPAELDVTTEYPIAVMRPASHAELARAFIALIRSPDGQQALEDAGFLRAP